ncbi:YdcF family protein [Thioalkalivibrio sulfidiphilus]|uniref:YdcF family protein n=1 Tax=Thioalkalivibrio sulfidiphilus TaxID=1033854 RepID=UPI00036ECEF1|nr:YdcF family protein [Thioalkalivibrio sulfidiphilus]
MLSRLLDPLFICLILLLLGLAGMSLTGARRAGRFWLGITWAGFILLWLAASPWFSNSLGRALQPSPTDLDTALAGSHTDQRALAILAQTLKNWYPFVPMVERLDDATRSRLLGGARIYHDHGGFGLVIVTGPGEEYVQAMADYLVMLGLPRERIVLEPQAVDTLTNASHSAAILRGRDIGPVVLVTSALHIPRAVKAFEAAGVDVIPAPVDYQTGQGFQLIPSTETLQRTARITHELLGRLKSD